MSTYKSITSGLFTGIVVGVAVLKLFGFIAVTCQPSTTLLASVLSHGWCAVFWLK